MSRRGAVDPCHVYLVGEGPHDIGDLAHLPQYRRQREGFLQPLLRNMAAGRALQMDGSKIATLPARPLVGRRNLARKAAQALVLAANAGASVLVFSRDLDRKAGRRASGEERRRRLREMRSAIESGFSAVADADHVQRVIGTPCRMIEAWALGDTAAVANVAGRPGPDRSPEALWGRETDPRSNHPKCVLKRAFGRDYDARDLTEIAEAARPAALERACPDSFGPFAAGVRRVFPSK